MRLFVVFEQVREMGEWSEGRRPFLFRVRRPFSRRVSQLIPLVLIVVTVQTKQLPVAPIRWIVVVVVVLVMDRELAQFFGVKFTSAVCTDPRKYFERLLAISLLQLSLRARCHASLEEEGNPLRCYFTTTSLLNFERGEDAA